MRRVLALHPDSVSLAASRIEVDVERSEPGRLVLIYRVSGDLARLRLAPSSEPTRTDELWRTTCFEAFLRPSSGPAYYEFNLAPSTQWAIYGFADRRTSMRIAEEIAPPRITTRSDTSGFELEARLDLPSFMADRPWRLGLSAVIEDTAGGKSYWALAHPDGRPDFHHPDSFTLDLPAMDQT